MLPVQLIQIILEYSDFQTQIKLTTLSKEYDNYLKIKKLEYTNVTQKNIVD